MRQRTSKDAVEVFVYVGYLLPGMGPILKSGLFPQEDCLVGNQFFIFKWLSVGDIFWIRDGCVYRLLLSPLRPYVV